MQALLIPILTLFARYFIVRAITGAGLSVISYLVLNSFVQELKTMLEGYLYGIPSNFFFIIHLLKFDFYLSTIISCYTIAMTVKSAKIMIGKA